MKNSYDFSKGIKNPYADKLKNGYSVKVQYSSTHNTLDNIKAAKASQNEKQILKNSGV